MIPKGRELNNVRVGEKHYNVNYGKEDIMETYKVNCFEDFCETLQNCGFTMGGANSEGVFTICDLFGDNIMWHTENPDTDPWEWRMRVLNECTEIAYSKLFFKKSGYITKSWYPYFLKIRRKGESLEDAYLNGTISNTAKRIYEIIEEHEVIALHNIKKLGNFSKEDNYRFEKALVELQMNMYITMCGRQQKTNQFGEGYGWNSTVFCTTEKFWGLELFHMADSISEQEAVKKITEQVYKLNPNANERKIKKFIFGK